MTNDEIIQQGGNDTVARLWDNNQGFIRKQAYRWSHYECVEFEDLMQCGFLAVADAVDHYKPTSGAFITLLSFYLKKHFAEWCASSSGWSRRQWQEAKDNGITVDSLNRQIVREGSNPAELGDFIPDPQDHIAELMEQLKNEALHSKLDELLSKLNSTEEKIIRLRYYQGLDYKQIAVLQGVSASWIGQVIRCAMRKLYRLAARSELEQYIDFNTDFYLHIGVEAFHSTGISAVERIVMLRENLRNAILNGGEIPQKTALLKPSITETAKTKSRET